LFFKGRYIAVVARGMWHKLKHFLLENQTARQTVMKNTFWLSVSQFFGRLLRSVIVIYAARVLGATSWGAFSYALGLAAFLTIFSDIGITGLITRESSREPELRYKLIATGIAIKLSLMGAAIIIFFVGAPLLTNSQEVLVLLPLVILLTAFDSLRDFTTSITRSTERLETEAKNNIVTNILIAGLGVAFLIVSPTSMALALAYVTGSFLGTVWAIYIFRNYFLNAYRYFSKQLIKPILVSAWPFGLMGLMGSIMINTDLIMIGVFRGLTEVGYYSAAQRPIQLLYILPGLLAVPLFPLMSRSAYDREKFMAVLERGLSYVFIIALPLTAIGITLGKELMLFFFGPEYAPATAAFQILTITILTTFPGMILGNAIFASKRERKIITYTLLGVIGNFGFNLAFIPAYGMTGAAWSTVVTQFVSNAYLWWKVSGFLRISLLGRLVRPIIATLLVIILGAVGIALGIHITVLLSVLSLIYVGLLLALKEPAIEEIASIIRQD